MRPIRVPFLFGIGGLLFFASQQVLADTPPTRWDAIRTPGLAESYALHARVRGETEADDSLWAQAPTIEGIIFGNSRWQRGRMALEQAKASESPDVRLRFDLGHVYQRLELHGVASSILTSALKEAPDHPAAEDAWLELSFALAKSNRPLEEKQAYDEVLKRAYDPRRISVASLNRAEADMRLGHLDEAVEGYRYAYEEGSRLPPGEQSTATLAVWGLSVAQDRNGDPDGAISSAKLALAMDPGMMLLGNRKEVFFVPSYEEHWYFALGRLAEARNQELPAKKLASLWRAVWHWEKFIDASDEKDRWRPLAQAHLKGARAELSRVQGSAKGRVPSPNAEE